MRLLLIRHGESVGNAQERAQGIVDEPLTATGRAQALRIAQRLQAECDVCAVYASPLSRARETAEIIAGVLQVPVGLHVDLQEYDCGVITGLTTEQVQVRFPELIRAWQESPRWAPIPGEEGRATFLKRVMSAMDAIVSRHQPMDTLAVVVHGGTLGAYLAGLLGLDFGLRQPWAFENASLSIVVLGGVRARVVLLNDTCHLNHLGSNE